MTDAAPTAPIELRFVATEEKGEVSALLRRPEDTSALLVLGHGASTNMRHAFLEAIPSTIQVIGLNLLYLAGGIVVIEYVFNYQGIGQELVAAVSDRDIPVIQFTVLILAGFYVFINIVSDVLALAVTPRRRLPRSG